MDFDYFYNREAERFNFLKVPEILVDGEEFKGLSAEAIILYSMLLKRTGMSFKNNWIDKEGRVFIYFTVEEIMRRRNISKPTAIKTLDELDMKKGIGLIERVRLGLGKPNVIYVKDFMSILVVKENDLLKSKNLTSEVKDFNLRSKENELQEVNNLDRNYIENNKSTPDERHGIQYELNLEAKTWTQYIDDIPIKTESFDHENKGANEALRNMKNEIELSSFEDLIYVDSEDLRVATGIDIDDEGNFYDPLAKDLDNDGIADRYDNDFKDSDYFESTYDVEDNLHTKEETSQKTEDKPSILGQIRAYQSESKTEEKQTTKEQEFLR